MNITGISRRGMPNYEHSRSASSALWKDRSFLGRLLQMVLAMEAGMVLYHVLEATVLTSTGYPAFARDYRLLDYWAMVALMALGMVAFMRYRRSSWRHCLKMTLAMLAPVAPLSALAGVGVLSITTLHWLGDLAMVLAMGVYFHYRPGEHSLVAHKRRALPELAARVSTSPSSPA